MARIPSSGFLLGSAILVAASFAPAPQGSYEKDIFPLLKKYCGACHGAMDAPGGVTLMAFSTTESLKGHREIWERVIRQLNAGTMPPSGSPAPTAAERQKMATFIRDAVSPLTPNPGRVTMRRLNREEYNNTIRDLFGLDLRPADEFPSDDVGYGFDNIGDVLSISPLLMEKYLAAARKVTEAAIYVPGIRKWHISPADLASPVSNATEEGGRLLFSNGNLSATLDLPVAGDYKLVITAYEQAAGPEHAKMAIHTGIGIPKVVEVTGTRARPQTFETTFHAPAGRAMVGATFMNDYYKPKTATTAQEDRNLAILSFDVSGPIGAVGTPPESQTRIIFVRPTGNDRVECERKILSAFASRAYRRPATATEVGKLVAIAELAHANGEPFERGIQLALTGALCSPKFLFRVEKPTNGSLGSYEIASRLSYFLWSSMPDDELFALAAKNELQKPEVLKAQVVRMMRDPRANALADNFAGQWLQLRKLAGLAPDRGAYPQFSDQVRDSMITETKMFFQDVVRNDRSVLDFLDSRYSFINGPLARLYGVPKVFGSGFQRVEMPAERAGVLTQASVLTVTSNPTRTSPVKRGKWILENILGTPPPPPPPGVGVLKEESALDTLSLRQRLEEHRKDPLCASCHSQMDGLGFALENFNGIGAWRAKDGKFAIDAVGALPDGSKFDGPIELRGVLMRKKDQFVHCLAEKLLTYALGRGVESFDAPALDRIEQATANGQYRFSTLVTAIVLSDPFRKMKAEQ